MDRGWRIAHGPSSWNGSQGFIWWGVNRAESDVLCTSGSMHPCAHAVQVPSRMESAIYRLQLCCAHSQHLPLSAAAWRHYRRGIKIGVKIGIMKHAYYAYYETYENTTHVEPAHPEPVRPIAQRGAVQTILVPPPTTIRQHSSQILKGIECWRNKRKRGIFGVCVKSTTEHTRCLQLSSCSPTLQNGDSQLNETGRRRA